MSIVYTKLTPKVLDTLRENTSVACAKRYNFRGMPARRLFFDKESCELYGIENKSCAQLDNTKSGAVFLEPNDFIQTIAACCPKPGRDF